ncbi:MAG: phosphorelay protein [Rhodospirillaceae bacterium]|nr:phosphorelay protein [Rhodospirillaceae bacterium]MBT4218552.1 phosphorelay protein [Rhodospirillaceae bacterium]MBT4464779.1 phosphorelay protein [Rhodospirillaceae bacterium]MBT5309055.1 phosphorelay protein [Rhodospirillaceae bacterium]MBT7356183.1 phosphorelay protein [Rhodospirillaceae bacterium]
MSDEDVQVIKPPNTLSAKVSKGGPGAVDLEAIERAEAVIAGMADNYLEWVEEDLVKLQKSYDGLIGDRDNAKERMETIFGIAHDMKGQGGSFNYDLMTILGNDLCRFIEDKETASDVDVEVIGLYVSAMKVVIAQRMEGDGGAAGTEVLNGLAAVVEKLTR